MNAGRFSVRRLLCGWALLALLLGCGGERAPDRALTLYCAAGVKPPTEQAAADFEQAYGVPIYIQYGGSGTLLSNLRIAQKGDLYLAADESYLLRAAELGLAEAPIPLAELRPVIAVAKGNPKRARGLNDLERPDLRTALAYPEAAAIGRLVRDALEPSGRWERLLQASSATFPTVTEIANAVRIGAADAGIVWDATANQYTDLEAVRDPILDRLSMRISVGVLSFSKKRLDALKFARFLAARDKGQLRFAENGYNVVRGDLWEEHPHLRIYCEPALLFLAEEGARAFEEREGASALFESLSPGLDMYLSRDVSDLGGAEARLLAKGAATVYCAVNEEGDRPRLSERMIDSLRPVFEARGYVWLAGRESEQESGRESGRE